jgi:plastocyanin
MNMHCGNRQSKEHFVIAISLAIITTFFVSITLNNSIIVGTHLASAQQEIKASIVEGAFTMADKAFSPNPINVKAGDTITWTNDDSQTHTVTSGTGSADPNMGKEFDSSPGLKTLLAPNQTFSHKFAIAGEFPYFCQIHPAMVGKVVVS